MHDLGTSQNCPTIFMATETKSPTEATNGKADHHKVVANHHLTLKASLQNAQLEKQKAMESFHQWAGAESVLQGLIDQLEKSMSGAE